MKLALPILFLLVSASAQTVLPPLPTNAPIKILTANWQLQQNSVKVSCFSDGSKFVWTPTQTTASGAFASGQRAQLFFDLMDSSFFRHSGGVVTNWFSNSLGESFTVICDDTLTYVANVQVTNGVWDILATTSLNKPVTWFKLWTMTNSAPTNFLYTNQQPTLYFAAATNNTP